MASGKSGHREPAIVAELGRPETPQETATRKAETSRLHRSNQTALNLVAALVVSLGVVLLIVLVVVRPDPAPRASVDYQATAAEAQTSVDAPLASPSLPADWSANSAKLETSSDDVTSWYIGFVTPTDQFVAVRQGLDANSTWLAAQLGFSKASGTATIDGVTWQLYDNRASRDDQGNLAYVMTTELAGSTFVLFGTAPDSEFETLAASLAAQLSESRQ